MDRAYRAVYWAGYRCARLVWFVTRPVSTGGAVAVWHDGRVLAIRTSYRRGWGLPGGGLRAGEDAAAGAARELAEEVGVTVAAERLRPVLSLESRGDFRRDRTILFEVALSARPPVRPDGREIVAARWIAPAESADLGIARHLRLYFAARPDGPLADPEAGPHAPQL